jgi:purine-binding chemotaxis protein CheW
LTEAELLRWDGAAIAGIGRRNGEIVSVLDLDHLFGDPALLAGVSTSAAIDAA